MIEKLENSDWVKEGKSFYQKNELFCPFCQQQTQPSLEKSLSEYFDESYEKDLEAIATLSLSYTKQADFLASYLDNLFIEPSQYLDIEKLETLCVALNTIIEKNQLLLKDKQAKPSTIIELSTIQAIIGETLNQITSTNEKIKKHNQIIKNHAQEKTTLISQVWKYILDIGATYYGNYISKKTALQKAIESLIEKVESKREEYKATSLTLRELEAQDTGTQASIDGINQLLGSFGFTGFKIAESDQDKFYQIQRNDGTSVENTLSEGEKTFISFLYFFHLLKGNTLESGITDDRVVVFDDPVSSLDSEVLFIVSSLIRSLFEDVIDDKSNIKQIFLMTHNVYFHKEVSFDPNRAGNVRTFETFWMVRKPSQFSKITYCETNPIQTSYQLLWEELKNPSHTNLSIQNMMIRILENYFKILGGIKLDELYKSFSDEEQTICKAIISWVNDGSHYIEDDLFISVDDIQIAKYREVFRKIFIFQGHEAHYNMMMRA